MSERVDPGKEFVTVVAEGDERTMVIIGIADGFIEYMKENGAMLQTAERNGTHTDIAVLYAPTVNEVAKKVKDLLERSGKDITIRVI